MRKLGFHTEGHQIATHTSSTRFPSELGIGPLKVLFAVYNHLSVENSADSTFPALSNSRIPTGLLLHASNDHSTAPPQLAPAHNVHKV